MPTSNGSVNGVGSCHKWIAWREKLDDWKERRAAALESGVTFNEPRLVPPK